jgi:hypothetical protein
MRPDNRKHMTARIDHLHQEGQVEDSSLHSALISADSKRIA